MNVPHPIPYQGSKRILAGLILSYFPQDTLRLVEPFAGSAALSIAAAQQDRAGEFCLNDTNAPLIQLWHDILFKPEQIADAYETLWKQQRGRERQFYDEVRREFNTTHQPEHLLYLLARCVKASVRYNAFGEFNQSPDNRRRGRHPANMRRDIFLVSRLLAGRTVLTCQDYRAVLAQATRADLVYMDPPYQGVATKRDARYADQVQFQDFVEALEDLVNREVCFLVSYDGRRGDKRYGASLPHNLNLLKIEVKAGRSTQSTLLGGKEITFESLYISPTLAQRLQAGKSGALTASTRPSQQLELPLQIAS